MQVQALSMLCRVSRPVQQRAVSSIPSRIAYHRYLCGNTIAQRGKKRMSSASAVMDSPTVSLKHEDLVNALRDVVPTMNSSSYKGQSGKVGVMGGCREYTGAPYFSAMSALRMGTDLAYVLCTSDAAPVIKSYSPELIVLPAVRTDEDFYKLAETYMASHATDELQRQFKHEIGKWIPRMNVLVIGPGLGDDNQVGSCMESAVSAAIRENLPIVIDGSGINFLVDVHRESLWDQLKGYSNCLLTPNIAEFGRLAKRVGLELPGSIGTHWQQHTEELAAALNGPILLSKGPQDIISNGKVTLRVTADGSPRRCGGQGDILTGTTAAFTCWILAHQRKQQEDPKSNASGVLDELPPLMLAAYGGCLTMRAAAVEAYKAKGRSMVAGDMIDYLGDDALQAAGLLPADEDDESWRAAPRL